MAGNSWWDLMVALYLIVSRDKSVSTKAIDSLLENQHYPEEIRQSLEILKKGFQENLGEKI